MSRWFASGAALIRLRLNVGDCLRRPALAFALALCAGVWVAPAAAAPLPAVRSDEPRAYGWLPGDVVQRHIQLDLPAGFKLDVTSLPQVLQRGQAIELRHAQWQPRASGGELVLQYQVFFAPVAVRTLELPVLTLRVAGPERVHELRVDAWPLTVSPLVPLEVSPRRGLGELQPDAAPPLINTSATRLRLGLYAALAALLLLYLAHVYLGLPWLQKRGRPFEQAWRQLRRQAAGVGPTGGDAAWRQALGTVHAALNRSAGTVLFERGLDAFVHQQPRYASLRGELAEFFSRSRATFFAPVAGAAADAAPGAARAEQWRWLLGLCRQLRDAERGAA